MEDQKKEETANELPKSGKENVRITVTTDKESKNKCVVFNTPLILKEIEAEDDASTIRIAVVDKEGEEPRVLVEGAKKEVVDKVKQGIVVPDRIAAELRKFAQFMLDHSNLKAVSVHAVYEGEDGNTSGFGFAATSVDCTFDQAVAFVNCGDANIDEFVAKSGISIPGRGGAPKKGEVITPTKDQIEQLG